MVNKKAKRECRWCGEDISHRVKHARYCNPNCSQRYHNKRRDERLSAAWIPPRNCLSCHKNINDRKAQVLYCSKECQIKSKRCRAEERRLDQKRKMKRRCAHCGTNINHKNLNSKYCSKKCMWTVNNHMESEKRRDNLQDRFCKQCGKKIHRSITAKAKFCSRLCYTRFRSRGIIAKQRANRKYRSCEFCGNDITQYDPKARFCGVPCKQKARQKLSTKNVSLRYCRKLLANGINIKWKDIPAELVRLKQAQLLLKREVKDHGKSTRIDHSNGTD